MTHVNLETLANGAFSVQVNRPFDEDTGEILEPAEERAPEKRIVDMRRKA